MAMTMEQTQASLRKAKEMIKSHLNEVAKSMLSNDRLRLAVCITVIFVFGILRYAWTQWRRRSLRQQQIIQHFCEPAITLFRNPWLFGIDVARDMFSSYSSGSRDEQLTKQFREIGSTFRTESSTTGRIFTIDTRNREAVFRGPVDRWGVASARFEAFNRPAWT